MNLRKRSNLFTFYNSYVISRISFLILYFLVIGCAGGGFDRGGHTRIIGITPQATLIRSSQYKILESAMGESSTFFLFGLFPATDPLDIEYAMSQAVQKVPGGQSMVGISIWHETHYYYPIGSVSVLKVEGKVIGFDVDEPNQEQAPKSPKPKKQ